MDTDTAGNAHTLLAENQTQRDLSGSRRRWRLAQYEASSAPQGSGPAGMRRALAGQSPSDTAHEPDRVSQTLLQPEDLWALSHLLMMLKYPDAPDGLVVPHARYQRRVEIFFRPGAIIRRMGYSLYGERYERLENSLSRLSRLMVVEESYNTSTREWVAEATEALLSTLDTGRRRVEMGIEAASTSDRRYSEWRIAPGRPLIRMLNACSSDLIMVPPSFWQAAGRSRTLQYLALDVSRHGYGDQQRMHPTKIRTLLQRSRLLPDAAHQDQFLQGELSLEAANTTGQRRRRADYRASARHAQQQLRRGVREIDRVLARFSQRLGFADIRIEAGTQADLSASQRERGQRSQNDRVQLIRWDGRVEAALSAARRCCPTWRGVLSGCNALIKTLSAEEGGATVADHLGRMVARLTRWSTTGPFARHYAQALLQRAVWLTAAGCQRIPPSSSQPLTGIWRRCWHSPAQPTSPAAPSSEPIRGYPVRGIYL